MQYHRHGLMGGGHMKTIKQIADELGVTKQAVHQKRKGKELSTRLQPFTSIVDGVVYISVGGEKLLKSAFVNVERKHVYDNESSTSLQPVDSEIIKLLQEQLTKKDEQLTAKDKQLDVKDNQLAEKDKQIAELLKLNDQQQQLLLVEQQKHLISDGFDDSPNVGIWERIFGRKKR